MRRLAPLLALAALLGCDSAAPGAPDAGDYEVRVRNVGEIELRDVLVYVSSADSMRIGTLARGTTSAYWRARAAHQSPSVSATASGQQVARHPIEGFLPGWNPVREAGRYTLVLAAVAGPEGRMQLDMQVRRD